MKKFLGLLGLSALSAFLIFGTLQWVHADDQAQSDNDGQAKMDKGQGWDKGGWGGDRSGMWKEKFGLTDAQAEKLQDLFKKQREESQTLRDQIKVDMDTLKLKVDSKASDAEIKTILDNLQAEKKKMEAKQDSFTEQAKTILTPTQQAKFLLQMKGHGMRGRDMWGQKGKMDGKECPMMQGKGSSDKHKGQMKKDADDAPTNASAADKPDQ
jgi:Spy/CpxP family protein refolding chaperone